ncbi:MAG: zinc ribbon domain-containing protein [Treponema sp.]|jgi:hypothetical protein|nr:zinc ribbon domain-containing protein [Treponema sp.]
MSWQTLERLLKPPFDRLGHAIVNKDINTIAIIPCSYLDGDKQKNMLTDWITAALNEKAERDFVKPMRWVVKESAEGYAWGYCPKCRYRTGFNSDYCPNCGQRLLPPEGEGGGQTVSKVI